MFDFLRSWSDSGLSPHGICLLWRPGLMWTQALSDAVIGLSYFSIPIVLMRFVTQRRDVHFSWVLWCFAAFILACGTTHFFAIWTLFVPAYGLEAAVKVVAALISLFTACALWPLLPKAVALPSQAQLREANTTLAQGIMERDEALAALHKSNAERDKAEAMLRQTQKLEAVGKLTGGLAHDFNNMLNIVVANLERVERSLPPESELRARVSTAMTGAERAASVTHKLLAFARQQPLMTEVLSVNDLIQDTLAMSRLNVTGQIRIETALDPLVWPVQVDPGQLQNAILNLLFNARDAVSERGTIAVRTQNLRYGEGGAVVADGDYVAIEVADSGAGMSADLVQRAFDPFFTTKPLGQGTGLGLSQVLGFAQQSGGDATIESQLGEGTTVRVLLPRWLEPSRPRDLLS